jgi:hypothetical protein
MVGDDRKDAAALWTAHAVAVERHTDAEMFEVAGGFDDLAAVIGRIAKTSHVAAVLIFHGLRNIRLFIERKTLAPL